MDFHHHHHPSIDAIASLCCFSLIYFFIFQSCFAARTAAFDVPSRAFDDGYSHLFGDENVVRSTDGRSVSLLLDRRTGSGFISSDAYLHGIYSASIKLPSDYTAGVVVAFYTSNANVFEKTHDELDFEFLGNVKGKPWKIQTNLYGNGSVSRGREERYNLWFDPTKEFHQYTILWTEEKIIFYIDDVPIREVVRNQEMGGDYPSKPMYLYATIWDGSNWATSGGRYKINYTYSPFVSEYTNLVLQGCPVDPIQMNPTSASQCQDVSTLELSTISPERRLAMSNFRQKFMTYSYCYDNIRYPVPPPECAIDPLEKPRFTNSGHLAKFTKYHSRHHRSRHPRKHSLNKALEQ